MYQTDIKSSRLARWIHINVHSGEKTMPIDFFAACILYTWCGWAHEAIWTPWFCIILYKGTILDRLCQYFFVTVRKKWIFTRKCGFCESMPIFVLNLWLALDYFMENVAVSVFLCFCFCVLNLWFALYILMKNVAFRKENKSSLWQYVRSCDESSPEVGRKWKW